MVILGQDQWTGYSGTVQMDWLYGDRGTNGLVILGHRRTNGLVIRGQRDKWTGYSGTEGQMDWLYWDKKG